MNMLFAEIDPDGEEDIYFSTTRAGSNWEIEIGLSQYIISIFFLLFPILM